MYDSGKGVTKDHKKAHRWYLKATERGNLFAQNSLGFLYKHGRGVIQDYMQAHKWYDIASANGFVAARIHREFLEEEKLTPSQIVEAQKLA